MAEFPDSAMPYSSRPSRLPPISLAIVLASGLFLGACGGGDSSPAPTAPTPPTPPTPPPTGWSVKGTVVATLTGQPIPDATLTFELGSTRTAADGSFSLSNTQNPASTPYKMTVEAAGFVSREVAINWQRAREGVVIDLIRDAPPFSMNFYRELARNAFEEPNEIQPLWRLSSSPRFYMRTVDEAGKPIEPEVLQMVRTTVPSALRDFTDGVNGVAQWEEGTDARANTEGSIIIRFIRDMKSEYCGRALIGATAGWIEFVDDRCNCGSVKVTPQTIAHEVGHSLGFFHVSRVGDLMYPTESAGDERCRSGALSAEEQYHARIAYHRARFNADPDRDPNSGALVHAPGPSLTPPLVIVD